MYTEHFGLTEAPFSIAPNPQYLYMSNLHRDALAHLFFGIQSDGGFILLTGEVGTGKTTLCRALLQQIPSDVDTAFVLNPKQTAIELVATICDEFKVAYPINSSLKCLVDALNAFLLQAHAEGKKTVLIIDEAQNLEIDVLEQLRLLTNLETNARKLLQIILLGQPELIETLARNELRQFSQRITARFHLEALEFSEAKLYIQHRMKVAGGDPDVFTPSALKKIYQLSRGIPRVINLITDRSLLGAYAEDKTSVNRAIVTKAAKEVLGRAPNTNRKVLKNATWAITVIALLVTSGIVFWPELTTVTPEVSASSTIAPVEIFTQMSATPRRLAAPSAPFTPIDGHQDIYNAYHDLFAVWGVAFEDRTSTPCQLALDIGLGCLKERVDAAQIRSFNRPVIVMFDGTFVTLSQIQGNLVTLIAGDRQFNVSTSEFNQRFDGLIHMFWRMPPAYLKPMVVSDQGAAVDWLVLQLSMIAGDSPPLQNGFVYDELMKSQVKAFQVTVGLEPSGVVDPITWIHINNVESIGVPTLTMNKPS